MASDTSRILLTLSIPIGFFSIVWFFKKQNRKQLKKTILIEKKSEEYQVLHPLKCSEQVNQTCTDMLIKEGPAAEKHSKNGIKSYASKAKGESDIIKQAINSNSEEIKTFNGNEEKFIVANGTIANGGHHESSDENGIFCDAILQNGINASSMGINNANNVVNGKTTLNEIKNEINKTKTNSNISNSKDVCKEPSNQDSCILSKPDAKTNTSQSVLKTFDLILHENGDIQNGYSKQSLNGCTNGTDIHEENCIIQLDSKSSELSKTNSLKDVGVSVNGQLTPSVEVSSKDTNLNDTKSDIGPSSPVTNGAISKRTGHKKKKVKKDKKASRNISEENTIHSQFQNLSIKSDSTPKSSCSVGDSVNIVGDIGNITCNEHLSQSQYNDRWTASEVIPEYPVHNVAPVELLQENVITDGTNSIGPMLSTMADSFIPMSYVNVAVSPEASYYENSEVSNGLESPTETVQSTDNEYLMVYEFEILPEDCGRLIGRNGKHVRQVMNETGTLIVIRKNPFCRDKKICAVHGTEMQINEALELIRKRFPIEHFPHITLTQINCIPVAFQCPESLKLQCPEGIPFEILLSSIVHAGHFFFQQPTHPSYFRLQHMQQTMTEDYNYSDAPMITNITPGNVCAAQLGNDWYRAEVVEIFPEIEQCRLRFLDYGGYACLPTRAIRQIKCDYMTIPFQATECVLAGVMPFEGDMYSEEARAGLEKLCQGKILQGVIVGYNEARLPLINLYYIMGTQVIFINQEMINLNHVRAIPPPEEIPEATAEYVDVNANVETEH